MRFFPRYGPLLAAVLAASAAAQPASAPARSTATLRIGLWTLWHDKSVTASPVPGFRSGSGSGSGNGNGNGAAASYRTCATCAPIPLDHTIEIRSAAQGLVVGDRQAASLSFSGAFSLAAHGETVTFRNPVRISARNGELVLAVTLPVESYVERVVASESGPADGQESLRALAIVVRSFALHQPHGHSDYDLCDSTHCQFLHWSGVTARHAAAHAATLATAGQTLWFHGRRAAAWFHQNCGGRTASPAEVWPPHPGAPQPPRTPWLISRSDPYCTASGAREWSATLSLGDLTAALAAGGFVRPGWRSLVVVRRGESGRAVLLRIGATELSAEDFRLAVGRAMGWGKILSTWFEVSQQGDSFLFHGRGSGHGVGLCQAGAAAMSAQGRDAAQIIAQYFPGATIADEATGAAWQSLPGSGFHLETPASADADFLPRIEQALAQAEQCSGIQPQHPFTVRAFRSVPAFRDATLAPGWVAAFTEGDFIATQPLSILAARKLLDPVLRHEFLHALVEQQAAPATPLWLREGLAEAWAATVVENGPEAKPTGPAPRLRLEELDAVLAHSASEAQSEAAHRAAAWYAQRLLDRYGRAQVLTWIRTSLPSSALASVR